MSDLSESSTPKDEEFEHFFSKPILRSGYFIAASLVCVGATVYDLTILRRHWRELSTGDAQILMLVTGTLVGLLWISLVQHSHLHEFFKEGIIRTVKGDLPLNTTLRSAARTTNTMLFFGSLGIWVLLVSVDQLLSALTGKR
jgi:hypothetical protein